MMGVVEPIYLSSIVVGEFFNENALSRALFERIFPLEGIYICLFLFFKVIYRDSSAFLFTQANYFAHKFLISVQSH